MLFRQKKYIQFLLKATNQHGVHSPFVFLLVTKCFYVKLENTLWNKFLNAKSSTAKNHHKIKTLNFDSTSNVFEKKLLKISELGKLEGISNKNAKLLIKIIQYLKPKNILEIGTSIGLGTTAIKIANKNSSITTIEGCPEKIKIARALFLENKLNASEIIAGNFSETLLTTVQKKQFDFIYFDSNPTKEATLAFFKIGIQGIHNDSFFIFNSIYKNAEMQAAWSQIKKHPKVRVTIDIFYFGIVFFRKEQAKENFKIRV
ncbi:hypothetical protein PI23P_12207 [Polaribacter irgensii 23-P]|uniref:O-methyltransferase n=1 Tax=Polaribacter irgensii 23-P TaxID=313594 RepID=A4C1U4_9FLAO|nr:hypothetical protein PI23P_12207 [Polaribacter irgensii 23-P]